MAKLIRANGEVVEVQPKEKCTFTLAEMQELVGGYIECIYLPNDKALIVNEEGKLLNLPFNSVASSYIKSDFVVGNALLINLNEIK